MKEKSGFARFVFYNLQTSMRADFSHEYRFVRVFLRYSALRERIGVFWDWNAHTRFKSMAVLWYQYLGQVRCHRNQPVGAYNTSVPLPLLSHCWICFFCYHNFSQADSSSCAFSQRGDARIMLLRGARSCIGGTRLTMRED